MILTWSSYLAFSQDEVILRSGQQFNNCKITKEDSVNLYFKFRRNGRLVTTFSNKENVRSYHYFDKVEYKRVQDSIYRSIPKDWGGVALGMGLDYGGLGVNLLLYPQHNVGLFGGVGYAVAGLGYNVGIKIRVLTGRVNPFVVGMYGYNTAIKVSNASKYDRLFYGTSLGAGIDFGPSRHWHYGYFSLAVLIPQRGKEVYDYIADLKKYSNVSFKQELLPIDISIGYRISF